MGDIYSRAQRVIICLGLHQNGVGDAAFALARRIVDGYESLTVPKGPNALSVITDLLEPFIWLLRRPWFTRI
jgi:hypothetical protein